MNNGHQNRSERTLRTLYVLLYALFGNLPWVSAEPDLCLVPAGTFIMGSDADMPNEAPVHEIYLDAYYIGKTEVTNAEYYPFWLENGGAGSEHTPISYGGERVIQGMNSIYSEIKFGTWPDIAKTKPNHSVIGVSWHSAVAYAAWRGMRLPTEAEWEKASRGTNARRWPWGIPLNSVSKTQPPMRTFGANQVRIYSQLRLTRQVRVPTVYKIWQVMSGSGLPIGIQKPTITTVLIEIRKDLRLAVGAL